MCSKCCLVEAELKSHPDSHHFREALSTPSFPCLHTPFSHLFLAFGDFLPWTYLFYSSLECEYASLIFFFYLHINQQNKSKTVPTLIWGSAVGFVGVLGDNDSSTHLCEVRRIWTASLVLYDPSSHRSPGVRATVGVSLFLVALVIYGIWHGKFSHTYLSLPNPGTYL